MFLLVLNCGSATVKYKLFKNDSALPEPVEAGAMDVAGDYISAIEQILNILPSKPDAVAHRVVHGGDLYHQPVVIDDNILHQIESLSALAPIHNPPSVAGIRACMSLGVPQAAVFDTAFHQTMPEYAYRYALPLELADKHKIRRYGFHGSSHQYVTEKYANLSGNARPDIIIFHMGNGSSVTAVKNGKCLDTSMGITPLEGLVMGTRAGDMDPGIFPMLLKNGMSLEDVDDLLWRGAGLKGIAGDNDMRNLLARKDEQAKLAVDILCYRARKYAGAYIAALGGAEAIIFTGGIGENSPEIRENILRPLGCFSVFMDSEKNAKNESRISTDDSNLQAWVIPTDEELLIAQEAIRVFANLSA